MVAEGLRPYTHDNFLIINGGHAPENHTGPLRRFTPDLVILVDAAQMNEEPGTVRWLSWEETTGMSANTHTMPPYMLARYLTTTLDCQVTLIGIQPFTTDIGAPVSPAVRQAVDEVIVALQEQIRSY
jgi:hydrogenase 3 maturation protease